MSTGQRLEGAKRTWACKRVAKLYAEGHTLQEVAEKEKLSVTLVRNLLTEADAPLRPVGRPEKDAPAQGTNYSDLRYRIYQLERENERLRAQIADPNGLNKPLGAHVASRSCAHPHRNDCLTARRNACPRHKSADERACRSSSRRTEAPHKPLQPQ